MEIAFIYIKEYKNFKRQSFCFSQELQVIADPKLRTITIERNLNYIPNFFNNSRILNVSAIIGQNGTGKSNILEFIRKAFPTSNGGFTEECLVIIKDVSPQGSDIQYRSYATPKCGMTIINNSGLLVHQEILEDKRKNGMFTVNYSIDVMSESLFVNYSNIVDLKIPSSHTKLKLESEEETITTSDYQNISTMSMLSNDYENYSNDRSVQVEKLDAYKSREIGRNIEFITSGPKSMLDFSLPESLFVILMTRDEKAITDNISNFQWVPEIITRFENDFKKTNEKKPTFHNFYLRTVFYNLLIWSSSFRLEMPLMDLSKKIEADSFEGFLRTLLDEIIKYGTLNPRYDFLSEKAQAYLELIDFNYEFLIKHDHDNKIFIQEENSIALPVNFEGKFAIQKFIELYIRAKGIDDFLNFKWRSLSSGEQSMLTLVSRFYQLSKNLQHEGNEKPLIILLDEPDVYFHPEWQRKLFFQLINYLPNIFPDRNIQIILTANTPYLVSDLPSTNVVMMRKVGNELFVDTAKNLGKKTFASNIHTLLSEDFYVSNFIGEFAKTKIEQLVSFIEGGDPENLFDESSALKCIEYIGEAVIRNRLLDMYKEKFTKESDNLLLEKEKLEKQLEAINLKINNQTKGNV